MALSSGLLLAQENQYLHVMIKELQQKKKQSNCQIVYLEGLSIQEGQDLFQQEDQLQEAQAIDQAPTGDQQPIRAPLRCSNYHILEHRRIQCPNRKL